MEDDVVFAVGVGDTIERVGRGERRLHGDVLSPSVGVGAQPVPHDEVVVPLRVASADDVKVHQPLIGVVAHAEHEAARRSLIAHEVPPFTGEQLDDERRVDAVTEQHGEIDDRLAQQTGYGGRADVLDRRDVWSEDQAEFVGQTRSERAPARLGDGQSDDALAQAQARGEEFFGSHGASLAVGYGRYMVSIDEVARLAMELPDVSEGERFGHRTWGVRGKAFAWIRPFSKADIKRFGTATPPDGPILAVSVEDLMEKEAVLQANPDAFFTIPHFDGYAAVLIQLNRVRKPAVRAAIVDGWLAVAPKKLAEEFLATKQRRR